MTNLKDTLTEIIHKASRAYNGAEVAALVGETEQAFKDAGWIRVNRNFKSGKFIVTELSLNGRSRDSLCTVNGEEVMTGQEWYDRFEKELEYNTEYYRKFTDETKKFDHADVLAAAKKASGLEQ